MNSLTNKDKYRAFCETRDDIPIFSMPWWLDATCLNGDWDICLYEKKGIILGALPFYITKYKTQKVIRMPLLTPYLGVQFFYKLSNVTAGKRYSLENKITHSLIEQLPNVSYFLQSFHSSFTNWLPFSWSGFNQTTRYSFILNVSNVESTFKNFRENLKRNLKQAEGDLTCVESDDLHLFYTINKATFTRQKMNIPYSFSFLKNLDEVLKLQNKRKIFISFDKEGCAVAAGYFVWDQQTAYYLAGGQTGNRAALSWTMWHAIQYFSKTVDVFDFEGSMVKNIAHFFSGFGATPTPYHQISKSKNKIIDILKILKN